MGEKVESTFEFIIGPLDSKTKNLLFGCTNKHYDIWMVYAATREAFKNVQVAMGYLNKEEHKETYKKLKKQRKALWTLLEELEKELKFAEY